MIDDGYDYDPSGFEISDQSFQNARNRTYSSLENKDNLEIANDSINSVATVVTLDIIFAICFKNYIDVVEIQSPEIAEYIEWVTEIYIGDLSLNNLKDIELLAQHVLYAIKVDPKEILGISKIIAKDVSFILHNEIKANQLMVNSEFATAKKLMVDEATHNLLTCEESILLSKEELLNIAFNIFMKIRGLFGWDLRMFFLDTYEDAFKHYSILITSYLRLNYPVFAEYDSLESDLQVLSIASFRHCQTFKATTFTSFCAN